MTETVGLYLHLPFCRRKCRYCDFPSRAPKPGEMEAYLRALRREIRREAASRSETVGSVYFGGGTPTLYRSGEVAELLSAVVGSFSLAADAEVTVEANPETLLPMDLRILRRAGFNRLSLGLQSADARALAILGRRGGPAETRLAVEAAREAGFDNVNLDIIFGLPEAASAWETTLGFALSLQPEHLSVYALELSPETPLARDIASGRRTGASEETILGQGELAASLLRSAGYERYEVSNYARPGRQCRHNLNYWHRGEYLGLGAASHSFLAGRRFWRHADPADYTAAVMRGDSTVAGEESPGEWASLLEWLYLRLRLFEGFRLEEVAEIFGASAAAGVAGRLPELRARGWLQTADGWIRPSDLGLWLQDRLVLDLVGSA